MFGWYQNCFYLCTRFSEVKYSGCSAVRLARQLRELEVAGSNPVSPTNCKRFRMRNLILNLFCIYPALYRPGSRFRSLFGRNMRIGSGRRRSCFACRTGCFRGFFPKTPSRAAVMGFVPAAVSVALPVPAASLPGRMRPSVVSA